MSKRREFCGTTGGEVSKDCVLSSPVQHQQQQQQQQQQQMRQRFQDEKGENQSGSLKCEENMTSVETEVGHTCRSNVIGSNWSASSTTTAAASASVATPQSVTTTPLSRVAVAAETLVPAIDVVDLSAASDDEGSHAGCYVHACVPTRRIDGQSADDVAKALISSDPSVTSAVNDRCPSLKSLSVLMKSFSTSDITLLEPSYRTIRSTISEASLDFGPLAPLYPNDLILNRRLDDTSRSCSTWVAVGDPVSFPPQISSPLTPTAPEHFGVNHTSSMTFVPPVNRRRRLLNIRKRILSTYRFVESLSRSQFDLTNRSPSHLPSTSSNLNITMFNRRLNSPTVSPNLEGTSSLTVPPSIYVSQEPSKSASMDWEQIRDGLSSLSLRDIEVQKGLPLSKYDRNILIFNWLQNLKDSDLTALDQTPVS